MCVLEGGSSTHESRSQQRPEEAIRFEAGVPGSCKLPYMGARDYTRAVCAVKC